ncbi:hypothetical protein Nmel_016893 [Mimus melanotis]
MPAEKPGLPPSRRSRMCGVGSASGWNGQLVIRGQKNLKKRGVSRTHQKPQVP